MPDTADDGSGLTTSTKSSTTLPDVPPENSLQHIVLDYRKELKLALAKKGLLEVAQKLQPRQCAAITDFDLAPLLAHFPAPGSRQYYSALQFRLQKEKDNADNEIKRAQIEMNLRTDLYTAIVASCEKNAKSLGKEIVDACDYASLGVVGPYFDGPRAHDMVMLWLVRRFGAVMGRTESDIQFYETALAVAKKYVRPRHR